MDGINNILLSVFCLWLFGILLLSIIILGGVLFKNSYGGLLFALGFITVMLMLNIAPNLFKYNPITLASKNMNLLTNTTSASDFLLPVIITLISIIVILFATTRIFNKKQL